MKTKFAIGCLVQWYECDMVQDYAKSLAAAVDKYNGQVIVDFMIVGNQNLEKCISDEQHLKCINKIKKICNYGNVHYTNDFYTIADYRRDFNSKYCDDVDVLMWGESDALIPKQTFAILHNLHQMSLQNNNPKYLAFFGTCKMWDETWKCVEHIDMTDKPVDNKKWWGTRYHMSIEEMNKINDKVEDLDVRIVSPHKFNGCGLIISSEVIRSGVNIPKSVFFTHEDSAFMFMTNKILGNIPQYIIKNILLVHNREHIHKRKYIANESGNTLGERRKSNNWYTIASGMSKHNAHILFNNNQKSYKWDDVWQKMSKNNQK
jgi:hypothetical protein